MVAAPEQFHTEGNFYNFEYGLHKFFLKYHHICWFEWKYFMLWLLLILIVRRLLKPLALQFSYSSPMCLLSEGTIQYFLLYFQEFCILLEMNKYEWQIIRFYQIRVRVDWSVLKYYLHPVNVCGSTYWVRYTNKVQYLSHYNWIH